MPLNCDRYEMRITVTETVTYTDTIKTSVLFSGLSTYYTINAWLAKGVGFVKGSVNGNSLSPAASIGGFLIRTAFCMDITFPPRSVRGDTDFARFVWAIFSRRRCTAERQYRIQRIHPCAEKFLIELMHRGDVPRFACVYFALTIVLLLTCTKPGSLPERGDSVAVQFDTVEVSGQMTDKPVSSRTFSSEDIKTTPGSIGDPMRTLDVSAEVVSNSDLQAIPIIGGDEADGILTLMDGFPITYPYRMLGSFSLFNPLTTKRIEFLTAGYPVS